MDFSRTGNFQNIAFHLQRHVLDYAPDLVLVFRNAGCKHQFPFAEAQLLDLIGSLAVHDVMCLLRRSWRNVLRDLSRQICRRRRAGFSSGQQIGPAFFRAVIVLKNLLSVSLDLRLRLARRGHSSSACNVEEPAQAVRRRRRQIRHGQRINVLQIIGLGVHSQFQIGLRVWIIFVLQRGKTAAAVEDDRDLLLQLVVVCVGDAGRLLAALYRGLTLGAIVGQISQPLLRVLASGHALASQVSQQGQRAHIIRIGGDHSWPDFHSAGTCPSAARVLWSS